MANRKVVKKKAGFLFGGLGAGARGFLKARVVLDNIEARFESVGGVDNDPLACQDFETLTGSKCAQADVSKMTISELRAAWGDEVPWCVFTSPPCKGFSRLLSNKKSKTKKYQQLNNLVLQGINLVCSAWDTVPAMIVLENVPGIRTRGEKLLIQVRALLRGYGYVISEEIHDCGEIGGLAQHRRRYLLVARQVDQVPEFIYRPPLQRVKGCGEVLGTLPLPEDASAGPMHRLPRLSWLNWLRLSLIRAGGDWRDLPTREELAEMVSASMRQVADARLPEKDGRHWNKYAVAGWEDPALTVTGTDSRVGSGAPSVADPRMAATGANATSWKGRPGVLGVKGWSQPARSVTGDCGPSEGAPSVADPRVGGGYTNKYRVKDWDQPSNTNTGDTDIQEGAPSVADPRLACCAGPRAFANVMQVVGWEEPSDAITGGKRPGGGAPSVADPRIHREARSGVMGVVGWEDPAATVAGESLPSNGSASVADPRLTHAPRPGSWFIGPWEEPAHTVRGHSRYQLGGSSVADPRLMPDELVTPLEPGQPRREVIGRHAVADWTTPVGVVAGSGSNGTNNVADPRVLIEDVPLKHPTRNGAWGVLDWSQAACCVTGSASIDNAKVAVADPRGEDVDNYPIIIAKDGTWHRPMTTLELAILQGLPARVDGKPLQLAGKSNAKWRERIGNAVPEGAGMAIAASLLMAGIAPMANLVLHFTGIWVRQGWREDPAEFHTRFAAELEADLVAA
jgi:site-specific DNA-cytosine methylase